MKRALRAWPIGTAICLAVAILSTVWPSLGDWMVGDREALQAGQLWRAWTAHAVHFSYSHLGWSGLLALVAGSSLEQENRRAWLAAVFLAAPLITWAALVMDP